MKALEAKVSALSSQPSSPEFRQTTADRAAPAGPAVPLAPQNMTQMPAGPSTASQVSQVFSEAPTSSLSFAPQSQSVTKAAHAEPAGPAVLPQTRSMARSLAEPSTAPQAAAPPAPALPFSLVQDSNHTSQAAHAVHAEPAVLHQEHSVQQLPAGRAPSAAVPELISFSPAGKAASTHAALSAGSSALPVAHASSAQQASSLAPSAAASNRDTAPQASSIGPSFAALNRGTAQQAALLVPHSNATAATASSQGVTGYSH